MIILTIVNAATFGILIGPLLVGYFHMVKIDFAGGQAAIGNLFKRFDYLSPGLVAGIVSLVVIGVGSMLCVLPGLGFATTHTGFLLAEVFFGVRLGWDTLWATGWPLIGFFIAAHWAVRLLTG